MKKLLIVLALSTFFCACEKGKNVQEATAPEREEPQLGEAAAPEREEPQLGQAFQGKPLSPEAWTEANNRLGLRLLMSPEANLSLLSPFSIERALGLVLDGAKGKTAQEMLKALAFPSQGSKHAEAGAVIEGRILEGVSEVASLRISNRIWLAEQFQIFEGFLKAAEKNYGVKLERLDFTQNIVAAERINGAVSRETEGRIPKLVDPSDLDRFVKLVITNAIYFKAPWAWKFDPEETAQQPFYAFGAEASTVPLMTQTRDLSLYQGQGYRVLILPFAGERQAFAIFLPDGKDEASFQKMLKGLAQRQLATIFQQAKEQRVELFLPRFKVESQGSLVAAFRTLGMRLAFSQADFSGIAPEGKELYISEIIHKAFIEVEEAGAEAAAATAVIMKRRSASRPRPAVPFRADHPFVYMIVDLNSHSALFMGKFLKP